MNKFFLLSFLLVFLSCNTLAAEQNKNISTYKLIEKRSTLPKEVYQIKNESQDANTKLIKSSLTLNHTFQDGSFANLEYQLEREKHLIILNTFKDQIISIQIEKFFGFEIIYLIFNSTLSSSTFLSNVTQNLKQGVFIQANLVKVKIIFK